MNSLQEALATVERQRKTIEVHSAEAEAATAIAEQFSTRNVSVRHVTQDDIREGFVIVRNRDGAFVGSLGLSTLSAIVSPAIHPPWVLARRDIEFDEIFAIFDNTMFSSYDRRQMLATAREIEERAWRSGSGNLFTGFQTVEALEAQVPVYERLAEHGQLTVELYVNAEWTVELAEELPVHVETAEEIGSF